MMTHTFRGKTLFDAKRNAFRELGEDAVIVTTRNVPKSGLARLFGGVEVEVSAMAGGKDLEPTITAMHAPRPQGPFAAPVYEKDPLKNPANDAIAGLRAELRGEIRAMKGALSKSSSNDDLVEEVGALRELLEEMREIGPGTKKNDKSALLLRAAGIEGSAAAMLARTMKRANANAAPATKLRAAIAELARTATWPLADTGKTLIALVGPSGVGKTTTAAKIAAQARMQGRSVMFVAADAYRVGAVEQLRRFADLLGAEIEVANGADSLDAILAAADADVVIVDTAGRGAPANDAVEHRLAREVKGRSRHILLCLSASTRAVDAERMTRAFSTARPTSLVITKLDETSTPAGIAHACASSKLPISTLCFGQRVPEDIAQATTNALVDYVVQDDSGNK